MTDQVAHNADIALAAHRIRLSRGCGETFFDDQGHRQQTGRYLVRVWCDCGWTGMTDVGAISGLWAKHFDGSAEAT